MNYMYSTVYFFLHDAHQKKFRNFSEQTQSGALYYYYMSSFIATEEYNSN